MSYKYYAVTNTSDNSYSISGYYSISIPPKCEGHIIRLPEKTAARTVARLQQQYPYLSFTQQDASQNTTQTTPATQATPAQTAPVQATQATPVKEDAKKNATKNEKGA